MEHHFDVDIAKEYGLIEAILVNNIYFWLEHNRANNLNYFDGDYWTYNSVRAFSDLFPYISARQIASALKNLEQKNIIKVGNYNKTPYDRTKWYALTNFAYSIIQKCKMKISKKENENIENVEPIPYINTYKKIYIYNTLDENLETTPPTMLQSVDIKKNKHTGCKHNEFTPPTLEEVQEYCRQRNNNVDAQQFFDYYSVADWKDKNGKPIRNWKQKMMAVWEKNRTQNRDMNEIANSLIHFNG